MEHVLDHDNIWNMYWTMITYGPWYSYTYLAGVVVHDEAVGLRLGAQEAVVHTQVLGELVKQALVGGLWEAALLIQQ